MAHHCNWLIIFIWQSINLIGTKSSKIDFMFYHIVRFQHISIHKVVKGTLIKFSNDNKLKHGISTSHCRNHAKLEQGEF